MVVAINVTSELATYPRVRETHGRVEVFVEVAPDHRAGQSVFSTIGSQPDIDRLVFRQVRERSTDHGLLQKHGENLESADAWG